MTRESLRIDELIQRLRTAASGEPPERVRYCDGIDQETGESVSRRLFSGGHEWWIDAGEEASDIKAAIEAEGYAVAAEQTVPDGFGRTYHSTYYRLPAAAGEA